MCFTLVKNKIHNANYISRPPKVESKNENILKIKYKMVTKGNRADREEVVEDCNKAHCHKRGIYIFT